MPRLAYGLTTKQGTRSETELRVFVACMLAARLGRRQGRGDMVIPAAPVVLGDEDGCLGPKRSRRHGVDPIGRPLRARAGQGFARMLDIGKRVEQPVTRDSHAQVTTFETPQTLS